MLLAYSHLLPTINDSYRYKPPWPCPGVITALGAMCQPTFFEVGRVQSGERVRGLLGAMCQPTFFEVT